MLTPEFYVALTSAFVAPAPRRRSLFYIAVGSGDASWDAALPDPERGVSRLFAELGRKAVGRRDFVFIDADGTESPQPTSRIRLTASFDGEDGVGTLRECGLFGIDASAEADTGTLLAYYVHDRIEKTPQMSLRRSVQIHLEPGMLAPGTRVTRYLGNSSSREVHDLENTLPSCQIDEIRFDHRVYLNGPDHASQMGYDFCAFCFGRERSQR